MADVGIPQKDAIVRWGRQRRGWTQAVLARHARVSLRTVSNVETGQGCRRDTMRKILRAMGIPFTLWAAQVDGARDV